MDKTNETEQVPASLPGETLVADRPTVVIDGYGTVYEDTGELVEIDPDAPSEIKQAFNSFESFQLSESSVDWGLKKVFKIDGDIVAAEKRLAAEIEAISTNWKPEINKRKRARESFLKWFTPMARQYAEAQLLLRNKKKDGTLKANPERSVKFPNGTLAFRTKPAKKDVLQVKADVKEEALIAWAKLNYPSSVVTREIFDFNLLTPEDLEAIQGSIDDGLEIPLEIVTGEPATEDFSVKTGIK